MRSWPFDVPENVASITTRQVIYGHAPILLVNHDAEDGGWQFLTGGDFNVEDAMLVALGEIVKLDCSIAELASLPEGWHATRQAVGGPWKWARDADT